MLVRAGVHYADVEREMRRCFLEAHLEGEDTDRLAEGDLSVMSVRTGIAESDIRALIAGGESDKAPNSKSLVDEVVSVIDHWASDARYTGVYGISHQIPYDDDEISFVSLVSERASKGIEPKMILAELIRSKCVQQTESGLLNLVSQNYAPDKGSRQDYEALELHLKSLTRTVLANLNREKGEKGLFERSVVRPDGVPKPYYEEFLLHVENKGQEFLESIDNWMLAIPSAEPDEPVVHTGVNVTHYIDS